MKSRAYIGFLLLAATSGYAQTIPDSQVVPLKKFSVEALNKRIEVVHGDRTIGAQCTPGDLTQYRIQKADGSRFWAQAADLKTGNQ